MQKRKWKAVADKQDKYKSVLTLGDRCVSLPGEASLAITYTEGLSRFRFLMSAVVAHFISRRVMKHDSLLYAEAALHLKRRYAFTMTVWACNDFSSLRDSSWFRLATRFRWLFTGTVQTYMYTGSAEGKIPDFEAAVATAKSYGHTLGHTLQRK